MGDKAAAWESAGPVGERATNAPSQDLRDGVESGSCLTDRDPNIEVPWSPGYHGSGWDFRRSRPLPPPLLLPSHNHNGAGGTGFRIGDSYPSRHWASHGYEESQERMCPHVQIGWIRAYYGQASSPELEEVPSQAPDRDCDSR